MTSQHCGEGDRSPAELAYATSTRDSSIKATMVVSSRFCSVTRIARGWFLSRAMFELPELEAGMTTRKDRCNV